MAKKYTSVQVPSKIIQKISSLIENESDFMYRSPSEFVIEAVRLRLEAIEKKITDKNKLR